MDELLAKLRDLNTQKKVLEDEMSKIKESLEKDFLTPDGYKDENVTISYSKASETTTIDLTKLEEKEPDLFNDLVKDYAKVQKRKASYSYRFK